MTKKTQINAYLIFEGNCREAMSFYHQCLGGKLELTSVKDSPIANQWPPDVQHHILHAILTNDQLSLLGSDMAGPQGTVKGNNICLALACSNRHEIETYFNLLSAGGKITHPLHDFFDGTIGGFTDKFGMTWVLKL